MGVSLNQEPELVVPCIILEPEGEEKEEETQMTLNLRVDFRERQRKCLSKALLATPPPAKNTRPEVSSEELVLDTPMVQMSPSDVVRSEQELVANPSVENICPTKDGTPTTTLGDNANERDASGISLSWEDITALLKTIPYFTMPKPPTSSVNAFFPFTHYHFVELRENPRLASVVCPSHDTLESALWCTYPMLKYTTEETMKVVRLAPSLPKST